VVVVVVVRVDGRNSVNFRCDKRVSRASYSRPRSMSWSNRNHAVALRMLQYCTPENQSRRRTKVHKQRAARRRLDEGITNGAVMQKDEEEDAMMDKQMAQRTL